MGCIYSKRVSEKNKSGHQLLGTSTRYGVVMELDSSNDAGLISHGNEVNAAVSRLKFMMSLKGPNLKPYNEHYGPEFIESLLMRALGVSEFQDKHISAMFEEKPRSEQKDILRHIYMNWQTLQQYSSLIEALKETKFVTSAAGGDHLYKPKDLFDPADALLISIFPGQVQRFPGGRFTSDGWLKILRKTGLRNTGDADTVLECARRVELLGNKSMKPLRLVGDDPTDFLNTKNEVSSEIWCLAETLVRAVIQNFKVFYSNNTNFCNIFGKIVCIPAQQGFPLESGEIKGVKRVLCSYSEAISLKDWALAWTVAPILSKESMVPPEYSWGALQLRSPPPFSIVLKHLKFMQLMVQMPIASVILTIEEAVFEVLQYLDRIWSTLSSSDIWKLGEIAIVPVANATRLVSPSCLYSYPSTIDTLPLTCELPSRYLPFVKILKEIGLHEELSISCATPLLSCLKNRCGYNRLSPNELRAVMNILHFLYNEITEQNCDISYWKSLLVVPDDDCRLVHPKSCVYIDPYGSQYVKYIDSSKLRFVHHDVSERLCLAFGIRKLSDVVVEVLNCVDHLPSCEKIASVSIYAIKQKLLCRSFQVAVSNVINTVPNNADGSGNLDFQTLQRSLESVAQKLQFVQTIRTQFWLLPNSLEITHVWKESFIPKQKSGSSHRALYYVDHSNTCMLIAEPPSFISVFDLVAIVVSHALGSPVLLPIGSLFRCLKDFNSTLLKLPSDQERVMNSVGCGIGFLGREVLPEDAKKAWFSTVRPFYKGEIVAWRMKGGDKLKYGRILENIRPRAERANGRINIETFPGKHKTILVSLVYSFKNFSFSAPPYASRKLKYRNQELKRCVVPG